MKTFYVYQEGIKEVTNTVLGLGTMLKPVIPTLWEPEVEGSLELRHSKPAWAT